jgi:hypothetical protein
VLVINFSKSQAIGQNFEHVPGQLTGLTSAVYTRSVSQIVQSFNGEPDKFKEWVKSIEKYATLTRLGKQQGFIKQQQAQATKNSGTKLQLHIKLSLLYTLPASLFIVKAIIA